MKTKNRGLSSRAGQNGRWLHSSMKSIWMEGKVLSSPGMKNTDRFTSKQCGIFLIPAKGDSHLNTHLPRPCQSPQHLWSLSPRGSLKHLRSWLDQQYLIRDQRQDFKHISPPHTAAESFSLLKRLFEVLTRNFFLITADLNGREGYDSIDGTKRRQPYQK